MTPDKTKQASTKEDVRVEEKVQFLSQRSAFPFDAKNVLVKETHMSWVFLANGFVYKMKKPVAYDFFDHRTLASRLRNSREEFNINQFLARDIYLGVIPLVMNENGRLQLEGNGTVVDWLVKMKRIPEENMLDNAIEHHRLNETAVRRAARLLATFYAATPRVPLSGLQYLRKLETDIIITHLQLLLPAYHLPFALLTKLKEKLAAFLVAYPTLFQERVQRSAILDAHGDLRPEHICVTPEPVIIDRLEFSKALRVMDPAEELAYLAMECEMLGNPQVGELFFDVYKECSGDILSPSLVRFYKAKKAFVRAYLVVRHLDEEPYRSDPKWLAKAHAYLQLAEQYLLQPEPTARR
ncbi:phosphotransferase [Flavisolibacter nicotianae]|uniref:phosphotransferase n=1 Tax=Flavisolibacter nicotianae TaxID=2364882 RepID=UPI000EAE34EB|nr:phosphotransferase [Flavisolibacter nicotianae]